MSYAFKITKDKNGIRLEDVATAALQHIPDGTFAISGHHVTGEPGWSTSEHIRVQLSDDAGRHVVSATAEAQIGGRP